MGCVYCKVINIIPKDIYDRFMKFEILLLRPELKEFGEVFYQYTDKDFITIEDYYSIIKSNIKEFKCNYKLDDLDEKALEYAKNITFEQFKTVIKGKNDDVVCSIDPVTVDYSQFYRDNEDHRKTYTTLSVSDICHALFHWSVEKPDVYFPDDSIFTDNVECLKTYKDVETGEEVVFTIRNEEC